MLDALKFVRGSVAKKDFVPELTHFFIRGGRITGYNGTMAVSSPIPFDIDCCPKAEAFVRAIQQCEDVTKLSLTKAGKLSVRSGTFKAFVECLAEPYTLPITLEGVKVPLKDDFIPMLKKVVPFIADDASRAWAKGIMFRDGMAMATTNPALIQYWTGYVCPPFNLPEMAAKELLRVGTAPEYMRVAPGSVTFHYGETQQWLWTTLYTDEWPPVEGVLDQPVTEQVPITDELRLGLEKLVSFLDPMQRVYITPQGLGTTPDFDDGASVEIAFSGNAILNYSQFKRVAAVADTIGIAAYPNPMPFFGPGFRGVLAGMRG